MSDRDDRYNDSTGGRAKRLAWRLANRGKLIVNKRRHRQRLALAKKVGEALRERFPEYAPGEGGVGPGDPSPAADGKGSGLGLVALRPSAAAPCAHVLEDHVPDDFDAHRPCGILDCPCDRYRECGTSQR